MTQCVFEEALKKNLSWQSYVLKQNHQPQSGTYLLAGEGEAQRDSESDVQAEEDLQHLLLSSQPALRAAVREEEEENLTYHHKEGNRACNDIFKA